LNRAIRRREGFEIGMILRSFFFAFAFAAVCIPLVHAQSAQTEISDKTLKTLKALAWQSLPSKIVISEKSVVEIDKSDPAKIIIPDEDAREIVRVAHLSARARRCDLNELVLANRDALLRREKAKKKWTDAQLQYINSLHLYTVQLLIGKIDSDEADRQRMQHDANAAAAPALTGNASTCNEKEKQEISAAVEANWKLAGKS
jgi:hypothetical protein